MKEQVVGSTSTFVLSKGFTQVGEHAALIGEDDTRRLFAELYADPDRPEVRPQEAFQAILSSMQPGWTLRLLQLFWPDPQPRLAFQECVESYKEWKAEGVDILHQGSWGRRDRLVGRLEWAVYRFWFENLLSGSSSHWSVSPLDTKSTFGLRPSFSQVTLFRGLLKNCLQVNECRNRIR